MPGLKAHLHAQQGVVPDHTDLPAGFEASGRAPLGVFDETDRSVSFGVVMRMKLVGAAPDVAEIVLVATNSAVVIGERMLSLYVYRDNTGASDIATARQTTKEWLTCVMASG